jgi:methylated-DNA-protein-cysteine methyltransferase related protein
MLESERGSSRTLRERIYGAVRQIPRGRVATYGELAWMAGAPGAAREVGWALSALPEGSAVPWWRVVNRRGGISPRPGAGLQAELLHEEGVELDGDGRIDLERYGWTGSVAAPP